MSSVTGIFFLLALGFGNQFNDLVSILDADGYFKSRQIEVTAVGLADLAGKDPSESKDQIAQLLAIRWLGEHPEEVKKEARARETLELVAQGKKGQDAQGFARDYAGRALARVDGKPLPHPQSMPENSLKEEAFRWFPQDVTFCGGGDLRAAGDAKTMDDAAVRALIAQTVPAEAFEEVYQFAETVGNIRLDRISFGYCGDAQESKKRRIFIRFTGQGNHQRLSAFLQKNLPKAVVKELKGTKGEPITVLSAEKNPPAFVLVGDTDFLMAAYDGNAENHREAAEQALDVQAGRKAGMLTGPLAGKLKNLPADCCGVLIGELPGDMRQDLGRGNDSPFKVLPRHIVLDMTKGKGLAFHFQGTMDTAEDAKTFVDRMTKLKLKAVDTLQDLPPEIKVKPDALQLLSKTIEDIPLDVNGATVSSHLELSGETLKVAQNLMMDLSKLASGRKPDPEPPAPPAPVVPRPAK